MKQFKSLSHLSFKEKIEMLKGPIFIFGASGFIGANLFERIYKIRKDCFAITHDATIAWRLKVLDLNSENIIHCDITSKGNVREIFQKYNPQTIFNLAAYGAYSKQDDTNLIYETNVIGTQNILEESQNIDSYVHAGSSSEYGLNSKEPKEEEALDPNSHYAVSKVSASYLINYFAKFHQVPAVNLRLYSIYGPWEEPDRLIPKLLENVRQGKLPPLVSPDISRDFVYIDDCIEAFLLAALHMRPEIYGQAFNIASGEKTSIRQLVDIAIKEFNVNMEPTWGSMPDRKWDLKEWYGNPSKAKELLHWEAVTPLIQGLKFTTEWQKNRNYEREILPAFANPQLNRKISCVVACYKDAQAIPVMYERLVKMFREIKVRYEIIFVNDSSPDNTEAVLEKICNTDSNVIAVTHSRNFGSQAAFLSGMEVSTGDGVVLMDGDLQDPPEMIPKFYEKWLTGFEVVYGVRVKRETSFFLGIMYKLFYRLFSRLSFIKIPVDAGDFSLMDRKVVNQLINLPETEQFMRGLRAWVGFKQTGVDYLRPERMFGKSTNNWRKNIGWAKKAIFSFSFVPLETMSFIGIILTSISFLALIFQIIYRLLYPNIPHGVTTIIVLILFFGGIQVLAISIIGEYISKIFEESKRRPKFIRASMRKGQKYYNTADQIDQYIHNK
jgi:nucleoside-diphosphate-sugar epimerase/glycosyltransferase involved in cell wall biosynthesis